MNSRMLLFAALAVTASIGIAQAPGTGIPPTADPTKVMDAIRLRQSDLDAAWQKYDFVETYTVKDERSDKKPAIESFVYKAHQVGNRELFRLVEMNGKPLDEKLQKQWDDYEKKSTQRLQRHPATTEQHSGPWTMSTTYATDLLRILQPTTMTEERRSEDHTDLLLQVQTDADRWSRYSSNPVFEKMAGTIRVDAKTFTLEQMTLRSGKGDSRRGGLVRLDAGLKIAYSQTQVGDTVIPHLEQSGSIGKAFTEHYQTSEVWNFADFEPTKP